MRSQCIPYFSRFGFCLCTITTVKVTPKKGTAKKLTAKITVKTPSVAFTDSVSEIAIGDTATLTSTSTPAAKVKYYSADKSIATVGVTSGVVTGVAEGTVKIAAKFYTGKKENKVYKEITVKKTILKDAVQTKYNTITATILGDTKNLKATDFKITNTFTNATVAVKSVKPTKTDATKFVIEVFGNMTDGKEYTIAYAGDVAKFTATAGKVTGIKLSKDTIPYNAETKVVVQLVDADGIVVNDVDLNDTTKNVSVKQTSLKGYIAADKVYLPTKGDVMTLDVTYGEKKYDATGKDTTEIKQTLSITAVDPTEADYVYSVTVGGSTSIPAWKAASFKANTSVKVGVVTAYAFVRIQDASVDPATDLAAADYSKYTVESSDQTKLLVESKTLSGATVGSTDIRIKGISDGTAYLILKKDNKYVASLPITVEGKSVATTFELDKPAVSVVSGSSNSSAVVTATVKDQYGKSMDAHDFSLKKVEVLSVPKATTKAAVTPPTPGVDGSNNTTVTFRGNGLPGVAGDYVFLLTVKVGDKELTRTITVKVVDTNTSKTYALELSAGNTVDTTVNANTALADKTFTIKVASLENGAVNGHVTTVSSVTIKEAGTTTIANVGDAVASASLVTSAAVVSTSAYSSGIVTVKASSYSNTAVSGEHAFTPNLKAGVTYLVEATFSDGGKAYTIRNSFVVKNDNLTAASYEFKKDDFGTKTVADAFEDSALVDVNYDGIVQPKVKVTDVKGTMLSNGGAFVESVTAFVNVSGTNNYVPVTITVNREVAKCGGLK